MVGMLRLVTSIKILLVITAFIDNQSVNIFLIYFSKLYHYHTTNILHKCEINTPLNDENVAASDVNKKKSFITHHNFCLNTVNFAQLSQLYIIHCMVIKYKYNFF